MKKLLILSGKGGTGKTTTAAAFIKFAQAKALADCDVDAPNLHLVSGRSDLPEKSDFIGSQKAVIDADKCIACGQCVQACRFQALEKVGNVYQVRPYACEGCGVCEYICPTAAVQLQQDIAGELALYRGEEVFSTAALRMGRGNSGKLVSAVKNALYYAVPKDVELAVIDGSPGIGCPVIASITGVDLILIVAEPSLSGLSDLDRIVQTAAKFQVTTAVCINKYDNSPEHTAQIEQYCQAHQLPLVGHVPYDKQASFAINNGQSLAEIDCPARQALYQAYQKTMALLNN